MVSSLNHATVGGNVMLKIDMAKAYDQVDRNFLLLVLQGFGFSSHFCMSYMLVKECISCPRFSIMMNGTYKGFFQL